MGVSSNRGRTRGRSHKRGERVVESFATSLRQDGIAVHAGLRLP